MAKKEKQLSMKEMLFKLANTPFGSNEHKRWLKKIQKTYMKKYSDQFILCTHGKFSYQTSHTFNSVFNKDNVMEVGDLPDSQYLKDPFSLINQCNMNDYVEFMDSLNLTPFNNRFFYYNNRMMTEYNMEHRQIIVNAVALNEDNTKAIVMKENNGKISLIGGHVDFSQKDYNRTVIDVLYHNMVKEMSEEVKHSTYLMTKIPYKPTHIVACGNIDSDFYENTHLFFMYVFSLSNEEFEKQKETIKQNESFHKPVIMDLEDIIARTNKNSVKLIINHIINKREINNLSSIKEDNISHDISDNFVHQESYVKTLDRQ